MLIKVRFPFNNRLINYIHPLLRKENCLVMLDYRNRVRKKGNIPILINKKIYLININSFIQNNIHLSKKIRRFVFKNISKNKIIGIGGESYIYLKFTDYFYSNSKLILKNVYLNKSVSENNSNLINYNNFDENLSAEQIIINLSKLNKYLMEKINNSNIKNIIIISCHHHDFWKKIKLLTKYKLIVRKKFIDFNKKYFITVNIFVNYHY